MKKIIILVEGQTEETFVRDVLDPHLHALDKLLVATLLATKRVKSGPNFKGGVTSWAKAENDLRRLLRDSSAAAITTMLDYYGLPNDFPGMATRPPTQDAYQRAAHVQVELGRAVNDVRFIPYPALHEFEALVYASLPHSSWVFDQDPAVLQALHGDLQGVFSPEQINENPQTAPSRRLRTAFPTYQKTLHGPMAVAAAGLNQLRHACPHFNQWLGRLECV